MSSSPRAIRVLVATTCHPPQDARIRFREIEALVDAGMKVTYAAPFKDMDSKTVPGLINFDVPGALAGRETRVSAAYHACLRIAAIAKHHDAVIIHDPDLLPALGLIRAMNPLGDGPALIWDVHEDVPAQVDMLSLPSMVAAPLKQIIRGGEAVAERMFHLMLAEVAYQQRFRKTHPVVPNTTRVMKSPPKYMDGTNRVVYVGALTEARGLRTLIEVAKIAPDLVIDVAGNAKGDAEVRLQEASQAFPNLVYHGFVPNDKALSMLDGALCGLSLLTEQDNYKDAQPTKLLEYMAHGLPFVTTPNPASVDLAEESGAGFVVGFNDAPAVVEACRQLLAKPELRIEMGKTGHSFVATKYNWEIDGPKFAGVVREWANHLGTPIGESN